jgi:hypothetical protein
LDKLRRKPLRTEWLNNREPDDNGDITAVINNDNGGRVSTFKGKSVEEVADKLLDAQMKASIKISTMILPDRSRAPQPAQPKQFTPTDKLRLVDEMADPEKVVGAVTEIFTATSGMTPDKVGKSMSKQELDNYYADEAKAFVAAHPEYIATDANSAALLDELKANGFDLTRNNLAIVFETLKDREELELRQQSDGQETPISNGRTEAEETPSEPKPPTPRPRSIATGIRNSDASASAPPAQRKAKYTRADIERMPRAEYQRKLLEEPGFRQQVDAMG